MPGTLASLRQLVLALAANPGHVPVARRVIRQQLVDWGLEGLVAEATTVVSELLANAVEHAGRDVCVRVSTASTHLLIEVRDGSHEVPRPRSASALSERGRGLILVDDASTRWGCVRTPHGKTVWAPIAVPAGAAQDDK